MSTPATSAPTDALFYSKGGSLYLSAPAGSPGRKLTDGPFDSQPAPSPDLSRVAFVRKASPGDYGGELWVVDLSPQLSAAGTPRRLVDPGGLPRSGGGPAPMIASPRWSPAGGAVAFVANPTNGTVDGGILLVADAQTGAVVPSARPPWAEAGFAWAPDGGHIAWVNARSDVRPVEVNVLTVGAESTPVASGVNALAVAYTTDGQKVLFTNGDSSPPAFANSPFDLKVGGVYSVPAPTDSGVESPSPTALFTSSEFTYTDITALESGAVAVTATGIQGAATTIQVLDGSVPPRTVVADVTDEFFCFDSPGGGESCYPPQEPVWGPGDVVAYLNDAPRSHLVVTEPDSGEPRMIDTGVDSFAWPPAPAPGG